MLRLLLLFNIIFVVNCYSQEDRISFSEAISLHLPKYKAQADKAYRQDKVLRAEFLFDSLIDFALKGSRLDNFKVKDLKGRPVELDEFRKPVYLITSSSWIVPTDGEIPALNRLAGTYHDKVDFVLLFWDNQDTAKQLSKSYNKNIRILYVDELKNNHCHVVKTMKHSLGFPTSFLLDKEKLVIDIRRKISHPYGIEFEKSFDLNFDSFSKGISLLLIKESSQLSSGATLEGQIP